MMNEEFYEVPRQVYKDFIKGIKKGSCDIEVDEQEEFRFTRMKSKISGKVYCARKTFLKEEIEKYYIFDEPMLKEDTQAIEVHPKYIIDNPKDLQKILDYISEQNKKAVKK